MSTPVTGSDGHTYLRSTNGRHNHGSVARDALTGPGPIANVTLRNVDTDLLREQYEALQDITSFLDPEHPNAVLNGLVEVLGDALPPVTCPGHGGEWGGDETCEHCTDDNGDPRPTRAPHTPTGPRNQCLAEFCANGADVDDDGLCDFCGKEATVVGSLPGGVYHMCSDCDTEPTP